MHAGAVQRKSRVYRPGLTKAQTSSRVSPLAMTVRHRRQRARPDGAALMRYVLFSCLKPLHLIGTACGGGGGAGAGGMGSFFLLRWRFTGRLQSSGNRISWEPYMGFRWAVDGAPVHTCPTRALALAAARSPRGTRLRRRRPRARAGLCVQRHTQGARSEAALSAPRPCRCGRPASPRGLQVNCGQCGGRERFV